MQPAKDESDTLQSPYGDIDNDIDDARIIGTVTGYDLKCPAKAEWRLRANVSCYSEDKYVCLFHLLEKKYEESCLGSNQSSIGSNLVFQPLFNLAECNTDRYQPIVFTTHGNSECVFYKTKCSEEGQVVDSNGTSSNDITCRCDYTKGYAFVSKPKNGCVCIPSEEDCTCFKVECTKLSPELQNEIDDCLSSSSKLLEYSRNAETLILNQCIPGMWSTEQSVIITEHSNYYEQMTLVIKQIKESGPVIY
ncbi:unnamed protein product [Mytilus coruscus]|uniref:Uncharacterized protein n=1 Tax=Mytilus coruscus TaxID=42192 RepID=A0A6J8DUZ5_MYTCO|nr:unnamed protein product [Mytilus coruscus]